MYTKKTLQFEYNFLDLVIEGDYTEPEQETNYAGEFDIQKIYLLEDAKQQNIYDALSESYLQGIKEMSNEIINE